VSEGDRNRLVACRACGNRVPRDARRCPACGTREPTAAAAESPPPRPTATESAAAPSTPAITESAAPPDRTSAAEPALSGAERAPLTPARAPRAAAGRPAPQRQAARRRGRAVVMTLGGLFALAAVGVTAVYLTSPPLPPPAVREPEPAPAPSVAPVAPPAPSATPPGPAVRSRSRGRTDWVFFFKPGDWLTRMADDGLLGVVVRVEKTHAFGDGSSGPAYVVQSMEGEERVVDADELERTARLR
jgi:hypothetical protein